MSLMGSLLEQSDSSLWYNFEGHGSFRRQGLLDGTKSVGPLEVVPTAGSDYHALFFSACTVGTLYHILLLP